ncbi:MAG: Phosphatidylglycerol--prolipoprotein diacylglyceryl transferase [Chlamydiales bacterium]|nr:Phosphatidylglycerol--prolipoprotein diacylglyceryl transferase [Chlamydiales bacterium]MCH9620109.1 Phosphatidylglycerol--prolipoprotein diacylglyceryl transferase [Chlamydiales bacterium]MCH9623579.1 Phosphatidylglycerol--prolipoprotein diacylglyceryl transferase [Chlamydiales bacterium]
MLGYLSWDPNRVFFTVPYINFEIAWYGVFFALGFFVAYLFSQKVLKAHLYDSSLSLEENQKQLSYFCDRFMLLLIIFSVLGARVGYIFFYGWPYYQAHPEAIFNLREGGLASHGGVIGALLALFILTIWFRKKYTKATFLMFVDCIAVSGAFAGGCIRIGNFFNQEITGTPTTLPWGINFLHPLDGMGGVVHPVQLYEALFYFILSGVMVSVWIKRGKKLGDGFLTGLFFTLLFCFRFCIEFVKTPQGEVISENSLLKMGQILSLPFFFVGVFLLIRYYYRHARLSHTET